MHFIRTIFTLASFFVEVYATNYKHIIKLMNRAHVLLTWEMESEFDIQPPSLIQLHSSCEERCTMMTC
jgi:hypothetical protein